MIIKCECGKELEIKWIENSRQPKRKDCCDMKEDAEQSKEGVKEK